MPNLFQGEISFLAGSTKISNLPQDFGIPEIAFIGKSNVGKSSLINTITGRKKLARISKDPGATKQINFFSVNNNFILVDLPGYGYSQVSVSIKVSWNKLITYYLEQRQGLTLCFILIDSRHGLNQNDFSIINLLKKFNRPFHIILTKGDKANNEIIKTISHPHILTSSKTRLGIQELHEYIINFFKIISYYS